MSSSDKLKIHLQEISSATNGFAEANIIGKGGYGLVYRGQSEQHGMLAVKRLNRFLGQGEHEYGMEISLLSRYRHENLVSLIGFCGENGEKILVYKYEANQSLDKFLHRKDLSWKRRLHICLGAACGLRYLHNETGSGHGVIHRDIKSSNILLDENWNAKISDFGLSKIALTNSADSVVFTAVCGTMGYVDPQILYGCGITQKSDVYSFGVVLYEVLFGKLVAVPGALGDGRFTVKMAKKHYKDKTLHMMIDPDLRNEMNSDSLSMFSTIAYQCLKKHTEDRPTMSLVVEALEKALDYHFKTGIMLESPTFLNDDRETTTGLRNSWKPSESNLPDKYNFSSLISQLALVESGPSDNQEQDDQSDSSSLISQLGRELSIKCLLHISRSDYGLIASLNHTFRNLVRGGKLYKLRRLMGITEHWVYLLCAISEWGAFDLVRRRWMCLPTMDCDICFRISDKESLAVGTELLVFGRNLDTQVTHKYSILTNSWSLWSNTIEPRCQFGSASYGELAIVAGGVRPSGNILSSAELYNSETGTWVTLPSMNKPRKLCSGVFMESKFYVIGGIGEENNELTCGEVYDLKAGTWTEIPNMFPALTGAGGQDAPGNKAPPLVAVVKNELYAAYYEKKELRKYDKGRNRWVRVGGLPDLDSSMKGWGLAFQACGDQLIIIGRPQIFHREMIELNSWVPDESPPHWNLLARKSSSGFVYNCAVMGC